MTYQLLRYGRQCVLIGLTIQFLLGGSPDVGTAASPSATTGIRLYRFGLHLFELGEYYRAITELKRFTLLFPQHQRYEAAQLLIGLALEGDGSYDDALRHFQHLEQGHANTDIGLVALIKMAELHLLQQRYQQAIDHFERVLRLYPHHALRPRTTYLLSLSWALYGHPERARHLLETLPEQHAFTRLAEALHQQLLAAPPAPPASPRTAGILAGLLPGAGHVYLGKPIQALTAFLLNGLFITGAILSFREGLVATGAILTYFETGWYLGNIKSAVEGARDANQQARRAYRSALRATYGLPPLTLQQLRAPGIGLRFAF